MEMFNPTEQFNQLSLTLQVQC